MFKIILSVISVFFFSCLSGCSSSWKITKETCRNRYYTFNAPQRWMVQKKDAATLLSSYGTTINRILLVRRSILEPQPNTLLHIDPDMHPHELAEILYSRAVATPGVSNVTLKEAAPALIDTRSGVKCVLDYQINEILFTDVVYGFIDDYFIYEIRLSCNRRHYFDESLEHFESVVHSFRLRK